MIVETKEIRSSSSSEDNKPWYELSVSDGQLTVDVDGDNGHSPELTDSSIVVDTSQDSVVAVEQDGGLVTYPQGSSDVPSLRAHLAWYDSDSDVLTVLEFQE